MSRPGAWCAIALAAALAAASAGCRREGCVGGDDGRCVPASACAGLRYTCPPGPATLRVTRLGEDLQRFPGPKAMASAGYAQLANDGDLLMENDLVRVVLDAPDHPQYLAPSGGSIIDLAPAATVKPASGDQLNSIYQVAGVLPRDAVRYLSRQIDDHRGEDPADAYVAVVFRGTLVGDERVTVVTRYELRACEPGLRVRTELYNGAPDANALFLGDVMFWGNQTLAPFTPGPGLGFQAPPLDLRQLDLSWRNFPFLAARSQAPPDVAYAIVPCGQGTATGFSSPTLSAAGRGLSPLQSGDGIAYERFILATPGPGLWLAAGEALRARAMEHGEPAPVTVKGRVVAGGRPIDGNAGRAASLLFYEPAFGPNPDDETRRIPWSEAVPDPDGTFRVTLPPDRSYRVQPYAFGRPAAPPTSFLVGRADADLGDISMAASARVRAIVESEPGKPATFAELIVIPVDAPNPQAPASFYGLFPGCEPMLGPPHGGSPACNRAVTSSSEGRFDFVVPAGHYYIYATRGPFATIDRAEITVVAGSEIQLPPLLVESLPSLSILPPLVEPEPGQPTGEGSFVSADLHVHGAASFDSSIPDGDRVVSMLAAGLDVVVASDHDVVTNYQGDPVIEGLTKRRLAILPGVEQTPTIPWLEVPGADLPTTVGHFNFWPLQSDPLLPRRGAPWDELREPAEMMNDATALLPLADLDGVRQLNHPYATSDLGRDRGFMRAIGYDPRRPILPGAGFAEDMLLHEPIAGRRNIDWDVQEVMSGASRADWLRNRALWFSLLSQGFLRAGTANSDSHSLAAERVGYPRNLVFGGHDKAALEIARFNADLRAGHFYGTNGPILNVSVEDSAGNRRPPGLDPIPVNRDKGGLTVTVTAAPWIPVSEIRVYVNGKLAHSHDVWPEFKTVDHFGSVPGVARPTRITLSTLLPSTGDAWVVVEAGLDQPEPLRLDDDGLPVLPEGQDPTRPPSTKDPRFDLEAVAPGVYPTVFSNPFILDVDGGGWQPPGLSPDPSTTAAGGR